LVHLVYAEALSKGITRSSQFSVSCSLVEGVVAA